MVLRIKTIVLLSLVTTLLVATGLASGIKRVDDSPKSFTGTPRGELLALVTGSEFGPAPDPTAGKLYHLIAQGKFEEYFVQCIDPLINQGYSIAWTWPCGHRWAEDPGSFPIGLTPNGDEVLPGNVLNANHLRDGLAGDVGRAWLKAMPDLLRPRVQRVKEQGNRFVVYIGADDYRGFKTEKQAVAAVMPFLSAGVTEFGIDSLTAIDPDLNSPGRVLAKTLLYLDCVVYLEPAMPKGTFADGWWKVTRGSEPYRIVSTEDRAFVCELGPQPGADKGWWYPSTDPRKDRVYAVIVDSTPFKYHRATRPGRPTGDVSSRISEINYWLSEGYEVWAGLDRIPPEELRALKGATDR